MPFDVKRFLAHDKKKMEDAAKRAKEEELDQADIPDSDDDLPELLPNDEFSRTFGPAPNETPETGIWGFSSVSMGDALQTDWGLKALPAAIERGGNHLLAKLKERGHTCWVRYPTGFLDWCHQDVCTGERMDLGLVSSDVHMRDKVFDPVLEGEKRARLAPTAPTWPPPFLTIASPKPETTDLQDDAVGVNMFGHPIISTEDEQREELLESLKQFKGEKADLMCDLSAEAKPFRPGLREIVSITSPLPPTLPEGAVCVNGVVLFTTKDSIVDHLPFVDAFAGDEELRRATSSSSEDTAVPVNLEDGGKALVDAFATSVD